MADKNCEDGIFIPTLKIKSSKYESLVSNFLNKFGTKPDFLVRVPGRVNIIGEHVDYCGFPVLPMAIEQNIVLAVAKTNDGVIDIRNIDKNFSSFKDDITSFRIEIPTLGSPHWSNYFLCGIKGILEYLKINDLKIGISVLISGNIPQASGLSSSSALVCSSVLATAFILEMPLNAKILATIAAKCERYIGTEGGGMDQAIALLAQSGCAQLIKFYPNLQAESIKLPNKAHFVVANSLTEINKAATSDFNQRVVECKISCRILAKKLNLINWKTITQFAVLQNIIQCTLEKLIELTDKWIKKDLYSLEDLSEIFEMKSDDLQCEFLTENTKFLKNFKLRQRTLHVLHESIRVQKFYELCKNGCNDINALSELMKQSHESLNLLYECSHPNLEKLIKISNNFGIGARLTGAGWGGCIVALCNSSETCKLYIKELKDKYYQYLPETKERNLDNVIFSTCPSAGAEIFILEE